MFVVIIISLILVVSSILVHYEALRNVSNFLPKIPMLHRARLLIIIFAVFIAHIIEISLFALAFALMQHQWGMGALIGSPEGNWLDYFYFSASNFTTLGMGEIFPTGHLRFLTAIESLTGLVLITWSASYAYLAMSKYWGMKHEK